MLPSSVIKNDDDGSAITDVMLLSLKTKQFHPQSIRLILPSGNDLACSLQIDKQAQ